MSNVTRPRKARILEKAGLRYVAGWLPADRAAYVDSDIEATKPAVGAAISQATEEGDDQ